VQGLPSSIAGGVPAMHVAFAPLRLITVAEITVRARRPQPRSGCASRPSTGSHESDRAGVAIVDHERSARRAGAAAIACLGAVADVSIRAGRPGRSWSVNDPYHGIARVDGATGFPFIDYRRRTSDAHARTVTDLRAVARVAVRAARAGRHWNMVHPGHRVAGVGRTGIAVIEGGRGASLAVAIRIARFITVASVAVGTWAPVGAGMW